MYCMSIDVVNLRRIFLLVYPDLAGMMVKHLVTKLFNLRHRVMPHHSILCSPED